MTYLLIFEKDTSEPEYAFDGYGRVEVVRVCDNELSKDLQENLGLNTDDLPFDVCLLFALSKGLSLKPEGYHFSSFRILNEEDEQC